MLTFDASAWLDLPRDFTDDELSDLIATVVDLLDERVHNPSVGTTRTEQGTQVRVSMSFDTDDQWAAARQAVAALGDVLDQAVPEIAARGLAFAAA
jgi:hypothetical protein